MYTLLLTGASGYLSRFLLLNIDRLIFKKVICLIYSEKRYKENDFLFENCLVYKGDISDKSFVEKIFNENEIDFVIHTAAMKYIDTCEKFQRCCINVNAIGTLNICEQAKNKNVKNVLTISTDKANNPSSLYGISKLASERITISHGFSVYQGVNFWNSDGSFIQKWKSSIRSKKNVILYNENHVRFFSNPFDIAKQIFELVIINNNKINYPNFCWKIKIIDVFNILKNKYNNVSNFIIKKSEENNFDKIIEEISDEIEIIELNHDKLLDLIDEIFKSI